MNDLDIRDDHSVRLVQAPHPGHFRNLPALHPPLLVPRDFLERPHVQAIFRLCAGHLRNDDLYDEVRDETRRNVPVSDSDSQRRQSNTVVRLTVITILGLIATVTTGYFGMNIIPSGKDRSGERVIHGPLVATVVFVCLVLFAVARPSASPDFSKTSPTSVSDSLPNWPPGPRPHRPPQLLTICKLGRPGFSRRHC